MPARSRAKDVAANWVMERLPVNISPCWLEAQQWKLTLVCKGCGGLTR